MYANLSAVLLPYGATSRPRSGGCPLALLTCQLTRAVTRGSLGTPTEAILTDMAVPLATEEIPMAVRDTIMIMRAMTTTTINITCQHELWRITTTIFQEAVAATPEDSTEGLMAAPMVEVAEALAAVGAMATGWGMAYLGLVEIKATPCLCRPTCR